MFSSVNPTTGRPWAELVESSPADVRAAVASARRSVSGWKRLPATRRGKYLLDLADEIERRAEQLAVFEVRDNGKLYKEMVAQLTAVPEWFRYYGGLADKIEGRVIPVPRTSVLNYTLREPIGVVGVITPWNSPIFLTTMAIAPALAAGNTVVVKPSEIASTAILELMACVEAAGFPPGVINVVTGGPAVGQALVEDPDVGHLVFTGSANAARTIAASAGSRLARATLELGGKSPNIVCADANLDAAVAGVLAGIFAAGGQTCVAGSRLLVERGVEAELVERVRSRACEIRLGDPMDDATQMGPIASEQHLERIDACVQRGIEEGAELVCGGARAQVPGLPDGSFYQPTILRGAGPENAVVRDEIFGPVLAVLPFDGESEAIEIANSSRYGLAAGVWTRSVQRAHRMARELEAGTVWINTYRALSFNSPFGGTKESGLGRENGMDAVNEFLQTKSVWCELSDEVQDPFVLRVK